MLWHAVVRSLEADDGPRPSPGPLAAVLDIQRRLEAAVGTVPVDDVAAVRGRLRELMARLETMAATVRVLAEIKRRSRV